jgi:hypothetical protein
MESLVECTQCGVLMTSWSAVGSPTRYYQCPFCKRTLCSAYGEVFERGSLARRVCPPSAPAPACGGGIPAASPEDQRWRELKGRAARWFARLEAEERPGTPRPVSVAVPQVSRVRA